MAIKSNLNVEVGDTETEIIEPTATVTTDERIFSVGNREREIIATAWGSNSDTGGWEQIESKTIAPGGYGIIILGMNHHLYVKLTGRTTLPGETSVVDGYLTFTEPVQNP